MKRNFLIFILNIIVFSLFGQNTIFSNVREHYIMQKDSMKLKALEFIKQNISMHISRNYIWKDSINREISINESSYTDFNEYRKAIKNMRSKLGIKAVQIIKSDSEYITEKILIENIDRAFNAWNSPWNRNLTFDNFCDYLLPYRVQDEPLEDWGQNYHKKFSYLQKNNSTDICNNTNSYLKTWFFSSFSFEDRTELNYCLSPSQLLFRKQGNCQDLCNLSVYVMRTLGLACSIDFTPAWATSSYSHFWCTYINENGEHRPFEGVTGVGDNFVVYREPSKVYRITYRNQNKTLANRIPKIEIPNGHLQMKNIIDVTSNYWRTTSITCNITKSTNNNISYVGVFNALTWKPVDWAEVINKKATFHDLSVGAVYIPLVYENGKIYPAGNPTLIHTDKSVKEFIPDYKRKINITIPESTKYLIYRTGKKYTLFFWDGKWIRNLTKIADETKKLSFDNIPANTLYLLLPEYSEKKERIFSISDNGLIERW